MASFLEKLKKGMGMEGLAEEKIEKNIEKPAKKPAEKKMARIKKTERKKEKPAPETTESKKIEIVATPIEKKEKEKLSPAKEEKPTERGKWFKEEGRLTVDVYQTENDLIIQSAIAGVGPEKLEITMEQDRICIKGSREKPLDENGDYFFQECFWGDFSREIILPVEVDPNRIQATMKDGVLIIKLPKILRDKKRKIVVRG